MTDLDKHLAEMLALEEAVGQEPWWLAGEYSRLPASKAKLYSRQVRELAIALEAAQKVIHDNDCQLEEDCWPACIDAAAALESLVKGE